MSDPRVISVNVGTPAPNPHKSTGTTGIGKVPQAGPITIRDPGPKHGGLGSGVVGDYIGDLAHHGGDEQAVYAFAREDLDRWAGRLGRAIPDGFFGENLTTVDVDPNGARVGEVWRIGDTVELQVTAPRIPCSTFRGWVGETGWLKMFTADARPGAYFRVLAPGQVRAGDPVTVVRRPAHDVTISLVYRAEMGERHLLPALLAAGDDLPAGLVADAHAAASA